MPESRSMSATAAIDIAKFGISDATLRNWEKLNTKATGRLTTRANKRNSAKRVLPLEYISDTNDIPFGLLASRSGWFIKGYRYDIFGAL